MHSKNGKDNWLGILKNGNVSEFKGSQSTRLIKLFMNNSEL